MRVIGVDEVGRGCLAGDLLICAYALRPGLDAEEKSEFDRVIRDSKSFSSRKTREKAAKIAISCGEYELSRMTPAQIDLYNIRGATLRAMQEAAEALLERIGATMVLFDGADLPTSFAGRGQAVVKGDATIPEIGAASIIAKTLRDAEMEDMDRSYPGYGFANHAGYGTREHISAIGRMGLTPAHRSWACKFVAA